MEAQVSLDPRLKLLLNQACAFGRREFSSRTDVGAEADTLNQLSLALNMLGEELEATTASKEALSQLNEQLRDSNRRLEELARLDPMTRLLNRRGLDSLLLAECERSARQNSPVCAVLLDCDDLKSVNSRHGHAVGDLVLCEISARIQGVLRGVDHVARVGGDEFLVILPDTRMPEAMLVAERIRLAVSHQPMHLGNKVHVITVSLGVASIGTEAPSIEQIFTATRLSLQHSKMRGKNRSSTVDPMVADSDVRAAELQEVLEGLCSGRHLHAVAQSILTTDEDIIGFELLSRRNHAPYSMPKEFFRVALENNALTSVDLACVQTCLAEATNRRLMGRLHINIFPSTLLEVPVDRLLSMIPAGTTERTYCVEISEQQCFGNPARLRKVITPMKQAGILIAVDDVGFGRTSLETLLVLEPDIIKIDRNYIEGVASDSVKGAHLKRMIGALQVLGAEVIAEGVERREDLDFLTDFNLPFVQGFLWGEPV